MSADYGAACAAQVMPRVTEANEISKELKRGVRFETKITPVMTKAQGMVSTVVVRVYDSERDIEWVWDKSKFINRVYLMREMYEKFENGELVGKGLNDESDPFWDPNEPVNIGYCSVLVKPLSYCLSVEDDYALYREAHQASHPGPMHRVRVAPSRRVRVFPWSAPCAPGEGESRCPSHCVCVAAMRGPEVTQWGPQGESERRPQLLYGRASVSH